jgi:plasmid stabilization system protein ParE
LVKLKIEWSKKAVKEIVNILDYYNKRNLSNLYSKKLLSRIMKYLDILSENPFLGIKTNYPNARTFIFDNHQIIYEIKDDYLLISMIWDSRRNPNLKF